MHLTKMPSDCREKKAIEAHWATKNISFTVEEYDGLLEAQKNCCAICRRHKDGFAVRFSVDHDHATKEIRGLLCRGCNSLLGFAKDSIGILENAIKYLSPHVYLDSLADGTEQDSDDEF